MKNISLSIHHPAPSDSLKLLYFVCEVLGQMYRFTDCGLEGRAVGQLFALKVTNRAVLGKREAWWIEHSTHRLFSRNEGWESGLWWMCAGGGKWMGWAEINIFNWPRLTLVLFVLSTGEVWVSAVWVYLCSWAAMACHSCPILLHRAFFLSPLDSYNFWLLLVASIFLV